MAQEHYELEIYDEKQFATDYPHMYGQISRKIKLPDYDFSQCLRWGSGDNICVDYIRRNNEDTTASFEFDSNGNLIEFEEETD